MKGFITGMLLIKMMPIALMLGAGACGAKKILDLGVFNRKEVRKLIEYKAKNEVAKKEWKKNFELKTQRRLEKEFEKEYEKIGRQIVAQTMIRRKEKKTYEKELKKLKEKCK